MSRPLRQTVLFVDGYNVIGLWPRLREILNVHGLETARRDLIEALVNYSASRDLKTQIVFDSQYQYTPTVKETVTDNLSVYYTEFGQTADTYIEKACANLRQEMRLSKSRLIVATSDRAQKLTVIGYGAEWMSSQQLANDVESVASGVRSRCQRSKRPSRRFLASYLDPESQKRLAELRMGKK
ncbi:MAG: NYN domain-containing protein [Okeania sp. SIO3I5]|uniref:NYN domain-containing protein n=1 Tax=Okeania sp. SIO3I5 TaxID=2607805 RepID=UPI0013BA0117|nr:NYN domain-containing protein [Okeania sp. SIO3I5]NEQ41194.1 NYN domain-containing protein [Okeania sp. SIO3I5]